MLDSNRGLACFSGFVRDPNHGTHATNHRPNTYIDMRACRELRHDATLSLTGSRVARLMLSTGSARILLGSSSIETVDVWKEALSLAGHLCHKCGRPCFDGEDASRAATSGGGSVATAESQEHTCIIVSQLPRLALLFHRDCFKCSRRGCDEHLTASDRVNLRGRSVFCVTSGVCKAERALYTTAGAPGGGDDGSGGGNATELKSMAVKWATATANDVEELFFEWGQTRATVEAERLAKKRAAETELRNADVNATVQLPRYDRFDFCNSEKHAETRERERERERERWRRGGRDD